MERQYIAGIAIITIATAAFYYYQKDKEHFDQKMEDTKESVRQLINEKFLKYIFGKTIGAAQL